MKKSLIVRICRVLSIERFLMKIKICFWCFLTVSFSLLLAENYSYQELFSKANDLYKESEFEEAKNLYNKVPNKTSQINYNLGNCNYKLGQYGYALLYWRRAEREWGIFNKEELLSNIFLLKNKLFGVEKNYKGFEKIKDWTLSFVKSVSLLVMQLIFLILWMFLFLYLKYLYRQRQRLIIVILFILIAIVGVVLTMRYTFDARRQAVVVSKSAKLLSGPGESFQGLGVVPEAREVIIKRTLGNYLKIKVKGQIGWIATNLIEEV